MRVNFASASTLLFLLTCNGLVESAHGQGFGRTYTTTITSPTDGGTITPKGFRAV